MIAVWWAKLAPAHLTMRLDHNFCGLAEVWGWPPSQNVSCLGKVLVLAVRPPPPPPPHTCPQSGAGQQCFREASVWAGRLSEASP